MGAKGIVPEVSLFRMPMINPDEPASFDVERPVVEEIMAAVLPADH